MNKSVVLLLAGLIAGVLSALPARAQDSSNVGNVNIQGEEAAPGAGFIVPEDAAKERSTVTQAGIDLMPASSNVYQLMNLLPGVNALSNDATGLFGGAMSIRGFDSSEIGFTVNGMPVNDSGNYAIYPQEYVDPENLQELDVTQGGPDIDQPQGGDVGGAVAIIPRAPKDQFGGEIVQSLGQLDYFKSFGRLDSGNIDSTGVKVFLSYSKAEADKFKGPGNADRDHVDFGATKQTDQGSTFSIYSFFNDAVNDSFLSPTLAQYNQNHNYDYEPKWSGLTPTGKQDSAGGAAGLSSAYPGITYFPDAYYKFHVNPFVNEITTADANLRLLDNLHLDIAPYLWYGYGNGGGYGTISESSGNATIGIPANTNLGNGSTTGTLLFYRPSITETERPGVNTKFTYQPIDWDTVRLGLDYDHSRHHQTQPYEFINADGSVDVWADGSNLLTQPAVCSPGCQPGALVQGRNELTFNDTTVAFLENTASLMNDQLKIVTGIKRQEVLRTGNNDLPGAIATANPATIHPSADYLNFLPELQASYQFLPGQTVFANLQKNARAPSNYTLYESVFNTINNQVQETAWNMDIGYRYQTPVVLASISVYGTNFQNRQVDTTLPNDPGVTTDFNAGAVNDRGFEFQIGTAKPVYDLSLFGTLTYDQSIIQSNLVNAVGTLPTAGKTYPNAPRWMASAVVQYTPSYFPGGYGGVMTKYTGARYSTLMNDQQISGFTVVNLFFGYRLQNMPFQFLKSASIQFNVDNLFDARYLFLGFAASSTGLNANTFTYNGATFTGSAPTYTVGAPRFFSVKLTADF